MKKSFLLVLLFLLPLLLAAQFSVVSTDPVNNAKNVSLTKTISITFSEPLDTNALNQNGENTWFSNIDSTLSSGYSPDGKTTFATVSLKPNTSYFLAFVYVKAKSGALITAPHVFYFTTGADFPPYSVSGTISSGSSGVSPEGAIVALSSKNLMEDEGDKQPPFVAWANVNSNGTYTIPYVANGTYWPIAAKDTDHDGNINPDNGVDVIGIGDSIVINGTSVSNINMTFISFTPKSFHSAYPIADSIANDLPSDRVLRRISAYDIDTLGRARSWEFAYSINGNTQGKIIKVRSDRSEIQIPDEGYFEWIKMLKPITNYSTAASSSTVIANVENAGGKAFRQKPHPDSLKLQIELTMSDQKNGWFNQGVDTNKIYWAAAYSLMHQIDRNNWQWVDGSFFLCDLTSGVVLKTQTMDVRNEASLPAHFTLSQNYPNPFNPATTIHYTLPVSGFTTLRVFDLLGKEVAVLVNEKKDAGDYTVRFDASALPSGIYFYQLLSGNYFESKKMVLMK